MAKIPPIHQTFYYAAPPRRIFAALTDPAELRRWFVHRAEISLEPGAPFRFQWKGGYTLNGRVKSADPPKRLVLAWIDRFEGGNVFETEARFELRKKGKGTLLGLTHRGFQQGPPWVGLYGAIQSGWAYYLTNLRSVLEHRIDLRSDLDSLS